MSEHIHDFGFASAYPPRTARMCQGEGCTEWAVTYRRRWREPTATERVAIVARMMEDVALVEAMTIIHHNRDYAAQRVAQIRGYRGRG